MKKNKKFWCTTASQTNKDAHAEPQKEDTNLLRRPCSTSTCAWGSGQGLPQLVAVTSYEVEE